MNDDWMRTDAKGEYLEVPLRGRAIIDNPLLNKGTAFPETERDPLGLRGLVPPAIATMEEQLERTYKAFSAKDTDLGRYIYLAALQDRNETLFYRLILEHVDEMVPMIYTPVVAQACQQWSRIFRRARGVYITPDDAGKIDQILDNIPIPDVDIVVVTDNERILGVGDQGAGGMGIPVGKLALYTLGAGIDPSRCLPVSLDVGTNNEDLLNDPLYIGYRKPRLRGDQYWDLVDKFVATAAKRFPKALIQFEDFGNSTSFRHLDKWRTEVLCFNDDIQGTAAVTVAGLLGALRVTGQKMKDQKVVFEGAGSAGVGIARQIHAAMVEDGADPETARRQILTLDSKGLVLDDREGGLPEQKKEFAQPRSVIDGWKLGEGKIGLHEVVKNFKPSVLCGVSGVGKTFSEAIIRDMAAGTPRPVIFPLSNPTSKAEATPEQLFAWTDGKCVVATGSPFQPVNWNGKTHRIGQCNNMYIFPGVGQGAIAGRCKQVTDGMFLAAARALAEMVPQEVIDGACVFPTLDKVREVSREVAIAVAKKARAEGLVHDDAPAESELEAVIDKAMWFPEYPRYKAGK